MIEGQQCLTGGFWGPNTKDSATKAVGFYQTGHLEQRDDARSDALRDSELQRELGLWSRTLQKPANARASCVVAE